MANLIYLRQRIKVVDTIKKTTNAMRLISMSLHSRLRHKKQYLEVYKKEIFQLLPHALTTTTTPHTSAKLAILVGSQKGLCGVFNTALFSFFKNHHLPETSVIVIGKQMAQLSTINNIIPQAVYGDFTISNFIDIANILTQTILNNNYTSVAVYSNQPKTFFLQTQVETPVWPLALPESEKATTPSDYLYEQSSQELGLYLHKLMIKVHIQELLFSSLLAEQSARFLSMDNSTRNAENLLQAMKLQYNKRRQADITRELTDLTGSLGAQQ